MDHVENSRIRTDRPFAIREWLRLLTTWRHMAALVAVILLFAWLGPFGTGARLTSLELLLYWCLVIGLNWALGWFVFPVGSLLMGQVGGPRWIGVLFGALVAALPGSGLVFLLEAWLARPLRLASDLVYVYASVTVVHVVIGYLAGELVGRQTGRAALESSEQAPAGSAFLARLSPKLGGNLLHLKMQDHYVEAVTDEGSELVLMRFGDALKEVAAIDGARVHRSHWVATHAVQRVRRERGRTIVALCNGEEVPVSRSFKEALARIDPASARRT